MRLYDAMLRAIVWVTDSGDHRHSRKRREQWASPWMLLANEAAAIVGFKMSADIEAAAAGACVRRDSAAHGP